MPPDVERQVDERGNDSPARHRRAGDGDLVTGKPDALLRHSDRASQYTSAVPAGWPITASSAR
jgi:hypothetical protein